MDENERIEIDLLLEAIYIKYGYDFRNYAKASIRRRIQHRLSLSKIKTIPEIIHKILYEKDFFQILLSDMTINVTEMFRDPSFFKAFRKIIIPELKKRDFIKIWLAGCSTGEEIYSIAILLQEENIEQNVQIYATDTNQVNINKAQKGIFPIKDIKEYTRNYKDSGGLASFADYYTARYDYAIINKSFKKNIVFSDHNLVMDSKFGEMDVIICRNVLIYFDKILQDRVFKLFSESLCPNGILCLGSKETVQFSKYADHFEPISEKERIYRKKDKKSLEY